MKTINFLFPLALGAIIMYSALSMTIEPEVSESAITQNVTEDDNCTKADTICCDESLYCGISKEAIINGIQNYREDHWKDNSPVFTDYGLDMARAIDEMYDPSSSYHPNDFDSRFVDINIDELASYICTIRNCVPTTNNGAANSIRFYFIKYPAAADTNFRELADGKRNRHTLALVPVFTAYDLNGNVQSTTDDPSQFNCYDGWIPDFRVKDDCDYTKYQNHNSLCPPQVGCGDISSTLLYEADH